MAVIEANPRWGTVTSGFAEYGHLRMRADKQIKVRKESRPNIERRSRYRWTKFQVEGEDRCGVPREKAPNDKRCENGCIS